jgi:hypothetical protein
LYTLGQNTYHKANVAVIVTGRGRASVALPPTSSAKQFYSCLRNLETTAGGGDTNFPNALGLASLLARKATSPRIIAFIAGRDPFALSSSSSKNKEEILTASLQSRIESFNGSELTVVCFASHVELGKVSSDMLESAFGKEKIVWADILTGNSTTVVKEKCHGPHQMDSGEPYFMNFMLLVGDKATIPNFIASQSAPSPPPPPRTSNSTTTTTTTTTTTAAKKINFQKSGPLQRSSFTCRDSCLDVLLHHSRSGLLRSRMPTYSTLAFKAAQDAQGGASGGSGNALISTPYGCYIRIMPQPKYRTILILDGALMLSRGGFEVAPLQMAAKLAAMTAASTRQLVVQDAAQQQQQRGLRSRPAKLSRGPMGVVRILQNLSHPEILLLTWTPASEPSEESKKKSSSSGNSDQSTDSATSSTAMKCPIPEPFNMFSGRPPVTLASLIQTLRGGDGGGGASGSSNTNTNNGIENALQNPFQHEGWEYWAHGQPAPFDYMALLTRPAGASITTTEENVGVSVVEKVIEVTPAAGHVTAGSGRRNTINTRNCTPSHTTRTNSTSPKEYEKGYTLLFHPQQQPICAGAAHASSIRLSLLNSTCTFLETDYVITGEEIPPPPPIWIPLGSATEAEYEAAATSGGSTSSSTTTSTGTTTLGDGNNTANTSNTNSNSNKNGGSGGEKRATSVVTTVVTTIVCVSTLLVSCTLILLQLLLYFVEFRVTKQSVVELTEEKQQISSPQQKVVSLSSPLEHPLSEGNLLVENLKTIQSTLSSLMRSPPWVSMTEVVQSIRDAVASNNDNSTPFGNSTDGGSSNTKKKESSTSSSQPAAIILGPLDPAAISYLMQQQQQYQQRQQQQVNTACAGGDAGASASEPVVENVSVQLPGSSSDHSDILRLRQDLKTRLETIAAQVNAISTTSRGSSRNDSSDGAEMPPKRPRKIAIAMGYSASSGEVAVTVNGRQLPLSSAPTPSGNLDQSHEANLVVVANKKTSEEEEVRSAEEQATVLERGASLPIPIPCSNALIEQQRGVEDEEEEVKMPPLTPPGAVTASVVAGARVGGLESSTPPPNPDTAE